MRLKSKLKERRGATEIKADFEKENSHLRDANEELRQMYLESRVEVETLKKDLIFQKETLFSFSKCPQLVIQKIVNQDKNILNSVELSATVAELNVEKIKHKEEKQKFKEQIDELKQQIVELKNKQKEQIEKLKQSHQ